MRKYKKFILLFCIFAAILPLLFLGFFMGIGYLANVTDTIYTYSPKSYLLDISKDKNRILIDSGSSSYYSLSAQGLEKNLGLFSINLADNGGVTLEYKINRLAKTAHEGDIILLPLEHKYYLNDFASKAVSKDILTTLYNVYFKYFSLYERAKIAFNSPLETSASVINQARKNIKRLIIGDVQNEVEENEKELNRIMASRGDFKLSGTPKVAQDASVPCFSYIFESNFIYGGLDEKFIKNLKELKKLQQKTRAKVIFAPPAVVGKGCYDFSGPNGQKFKDFLAKARQIVQDEGFSFIGEWQDGYFDNPDIYMLDTQYHLNAKGREIYTRRIIELLRPYIAS